ncbi:MAG TPA: hypothetical protein VJ724_02060 [Tahibacter sp.]|nr:hypothetical protein [Tahibacter sp.]
MTRYLARTLGLALAASLAACGSDKPPETAKAADATPASQKIANPLPANPRPVNTGFEYGGPTPKPGDMPPIRRLGNSVCDQFVEKARQCVNSGVLAKDERRKAVLAIDNIARTAMMKSGDGMSEACLNLQAELQPKLVSGGCQNF